MAALDPVHKEAVAALVVPIAIQPVRVAVFERVAVEGRQRRQQLNLYR